MFTQTHGTWGERLRTKKWGALGISTILFLKPNKRCSWHSHKTVWNQFTCIQGKVGIKTDLDQEEHQTTILLPKQTFTVAPGFYHEFQTYEEGAIVEEHAFVEYDENDIDRENIGGQLEPDLPFGE